VQNGVISWLAQPVKSSGESGPMENLSKRWLWQYRNRQPFAIQEHVQDAWFLGQKWKKKSLVSAYCGIARAIFHVYILLIYILIWFILLR
jgi:hypothetical protein